MHPLGGNVCNFRSFTFEIVSKLLFAGPEMRVGQDAFAQVGRGLVEESPHLRVGAALWFGIMVADAGDVKVPVQGCMASETLCISDTVAYGLIIVAVASFLLP